MHEFKPKVWMTCPLCGKQSPFPDPDHKEWVGLTDDEVAQLAQHELWLKNFIRQVEAKLKEKNA